MLRERFSHPTLAWTVLTIMLMIVTVALSMQDSRRMFRASVTDALPSCEGMPILLDYPQPGPDGPFEECQFQCADSQQYYLVYTDVNPGSGMLSAMQCGKDPSCVNTGESGMWECDSAMQPSAITVNVDYPDGISSSSVATAGSGALSSPFVPLPIASTASETSSAGLSPWTLTLHRSSSSRSTENSQASSLGEEEVPPESSSAQEITEMEPQQSVCGNGILEPQGGEECDPPSPAGFEGAGNGPENGQSGLLCSAVCRLLQTPRCGNGVIETGEECDNGLQNAAPPAPCSPACRGYAAVATVAAASVCGNGVLEAPEQCDYGQMNGMPGGLCDRECRVVVFDPQVHGAATLASLMPVPQVQGATGPAVLGAVAGGAAAGWAWMRRKKKS